MFVRIFYDQSQRAGEYFTQAQPRPRATARTSAGGRLACLRIHRATRTRTRE